MSLLTWRVRVTMKAGSVHEHTAGNLVFGSDLFTLASLPDLHLINYDPAAIASFTAEVIEPPDVAGWEAPYRGGRPGEWTPVRR